MTSLFYWVRRLYSLDTLDPRFTVSSTTPLKATGDAGPPTTKDARANAIASGSSPSKWGTPEFYFYYFIFITVVPMMFKTVVDVSQESFPTYSTYEHLLSTGWIPGRKVDNSDAQYATFRDNIPYLLTLLVAHPLLRRVYEYCTSSSRYGSSSPIAAGDTRLARRIPFDFYFALLFIVALHGVSAVKVLVLLYINYRIGKTLPRPYIPAVTWIFNICILFANELCSGYRFEKVAMLFTSSAGVPGEQESQLVQWGRMLDSFGGIMPRWEVLFNIAILRMISFNMDYYWSLDYPAASPIEKKQLDPTALSERDRVNIPAEPSAFNPRNYLAYMLYSPLYLAGPILTFNDYIAQQRHASPSVTRTRTFLYGLRFFLTLLCMELILHYIYAVAISKSTTDWSAYSPGQLSMLAFFNLHIIWLKLLIPWRFFRLWALVDGIDPPENMVRCMSNNYSAFAFWRGWHRSLNRWVVRYLYVPLGGGESPSKPTSTTTRTTNLVAKIRRVTNVLAVFTFMALWHDINLRLLMWGWLITLFVLPEVVATLLFPPQKWKTRPTAYRVLCGIGAVGNILMMMMANLVGFAVGLDGLKGLLEGIM
ncbi:glycerol, partial [Aspergillus sclerotialis]